jgi:hypothetical protein
MVACGVAQDRPDEVALACSGSSVVGVGVVWSAWGGPIAKGKGKALWKGVGYAANFVLDRKQPGTFVDAYLRLTVTVTAKHPASLGTVRRWALDDETTLQDVDPPVAVAPPATQPPVAPATAAPATAPPTTRVLVTTPPLSPPTTLQRGFNAGETAIVRNWKVRVPVWQLDANASIVAANQFNDLPPAGSQYVLLTLEAEWTGPNAATPRSDLETGLATSDGRVWPQASVIEVRGSNGDDVKVGTGYKATALRAFAVPSDQVTKPLTLVLIDDSSYPPSAPVSLRVTG